MRTQVESSIASFDDASAREIPDSLRRVLLAENGWILFGGGLHVRGICHEPSWHSIFTVWKGELALHRTYGHLRPDDIPFAEDCMGDQFILRSDRVHRLTLETGFLEDLNLALDEFLTKAETQPGDLLQMEPLLRLEKQGRRLVPGQLVHSYPPFSTAQAAQGVSLSAVDANARIAFALDFYTQVENLQDGETFTIRIIS